MDKTTTLGLPKPPKGSNAFTGYMKNDSGVEDTPARIALDKIDAAIAALDGAGEGTFVVTAPTGDQTISAHKLIIPNGVTAPVTGALTGNSAGTHTGGVVGDVQETLHTALVANAAIASKQGIVPLGSSGALAMTLADPTTGTDDGKRLSVYASTAHAHVVTVTGGIAGGTNNTLTLGGAIGDNFELEAIGGKWFLRSSLNATASHV